MKKHVILLYLLLAIAMPAQAAQSGASCGCDCKATGKTFFSLKSPYQTTSPELIVHFRDRMNAAEDGFGGAVQVTVLGGRSTNREDLAQYFMPNCKTSLSVTEQQQEGTDIVSAQFNIVTVDGNFESQIRFCPQSSIVGAGFTWRQRFCENDEGRAFFGYISGPVFRVKNQMNLSERVIQDGGGVNPELSAASEEINGFPLVANATEAFKQAAWHCGKIDDCCGPKTNSSRSGCCDQSKTRFAHLEIAAGYEWINEETCKLESFFGGTIGTGNRPCGEYLFEPIVGNNGHNGVFWGTRVGMEFWHHETEDRGLWFYIDYTGRYLFSRCERRLVDVKCKPWSRYMLVYNSQEQAQQAADLCAQTPNTTATNQGIILGTPGVNVFCLDLKVQPRFTHMFNSAFVYRNPCLEAEIGYDYFSRDSECIQLGCDFREQYAFKSLLGCGATNSQQTIGEQFDAADLPVAQYEENIIRKTDLDLESAAHPNMVVHTIYGSLAYRWDDRECPLFAGFGGSYEWGPDNTTMNRWLLWGKLGMSF